MNAAERTIERLESTSQAWWLFSFLGRALLAIAGALVVLQLVIFVDVLFRLPPAGRWTLLSVWGFSIAALAALVIWKTMEGPRSVEATARRIEQAFPSLGNDLINLVQLARQVETAGGRFCQAAMMDTVRRVEQVEFHPQKAAASRWDRLRWGLQTPRDVFESATIVLAAIAVTYGLVAFVPRWSSALSRVLHPWSDIPMVGSVEILKVVPGDGEVLAGSGLDIRAMIRNPDGKHHRAVLSIFDDAGKRKDIAMVANEGKDTYVAALPSVVQGFRYRISIGDSQTRSYTITTVQKPVVERVDVEYRFPAYLRREPERLSQTHGDLQAPQFTVARLTIHTSTPIARGHVIVGGREEGGLVSDDGRKLRVRMFLEESGTYTIHLFTKSGHTDHAPRVNQIRVLPDRPPQVRLVKPPPESTLARTASLPVAVEASDDYGLESIRIEMRLDGESEDPNAAPIRIVQTWKQLEGTPRTALAAEVPLDLPGIGQAESLLVRAVAADGRQYSTDFKPQETASPWHRIVLVTAETQAAQRLERLDVLRARLWEILRLQLRARQAAAASLSELTEAQGIGRRLGEQQTVIYRRSMALVEETQPTSEEERSIRSSVARLASGPMVDAIRQCETLAGVDELAQWESASGELRSTQDGIIEALRRLLGEARRATAETLAEMKKRPGGDLPADVQEKLRELKDKLAEFLKQQKKVIEATKDLAKKPVDDFTEEDEQLLKDLAAAEDEWSRFMEDFRSDLSKLPEQDFANASLLEELVEIQTELKMAEGALTKKTAKIAVPLEQLGAEMAEEMTTNIEKWLPDTPDREKWSLEEPPDDSMKEAPMAELPGELEDLVGELMEEEEDLFDEMEDVSSSWADSLDKGAGWDAADGPISNMSARGVTGNRLPNTSEIRGRSGEGRQGKASGEFVGDTAVGKGGRKTPSRLTPDPNVKGQIKDVSKDPVGGATGGGKESGQGGEGLEGPLPPHRQRELQRLANKQAALRNKAESIDLRFQVLNYHDTDWKRLMEQMAAVESDLRSGHYRQALRRRKVVLEKMKRTKMYVDGELEIRKDATPSVPADVQKEILGSMADPSPAGWQRLNRKYYEQLSTGKSTGRQDRSETKGP